jgi:peptide/nickel transport system permease protein
MTTSTTTPTSTWNEADSWLAQPPATGFRRIVKTVWSFSKRKPLGAVCGVIIILCIIFGDLIPETANGITSVAGLGTPVPYLVDTLAEHTPFVYPYGEQNLQNRLAGMSFDHWLGTDQVGRDIFSRLLYGARVAVMVSFGAVFISELMAVTIGIVCGYYGGLIDKSAYRIVDIFQALPGLVVLITILGLLGSGLWEMVLVIGLIGGPSGSRLFRGQVIAIMSSPFIEAARVVGASDKRIMLKYLLPNIMPLLILAATVRLGGVVLIVASLSFLGYGLPPPFPDWGGMLSLEGRQYMRRQPGLAIYPGVAIGILVFSFNLFGDALRDVLDPRLRGGR